MKVEIKIEFEYPSGGGKKAPLLDTTDENTGVDKGTATEKISFPCDPPSYVYLADADKFYMSPDSNVVPKAILTIVTDTGSTHTLEFELVRSDTLSAQYTPADSSTAVHAYVAKNCQQVKDFALSAVNQANSTVNITLQTKVRFLDNGSPEGSYPFYSRAGTPSGVQTFGSASYFSDGTSGSGDDGGPGTILP